MLTKEHKAALINLAFEGEQENYNRYWVIGFQKALSVANSELRKQMLEFLATRNTLTQRLYLELMLLVR